MRTQMALPGILCVMTVQWWFVNPDTFVPAGNFRINEFSGLLNRQILDISELLINVRLGYCFTPYQRLWLYNGAPLVAFYDTLGIRRTYSRLKPRRPHGGLINVLNCSQLIASFRGIYVALNRTGFCFFLLLLLFNMFWPLKRPFYCFFSVCFWLLKRPLYCFFSICLWSWKWPFGIP